MPMEFSGDSYPKLPVQQNDPLGTIGKLQGIEQQGIAIDREKLAKYNEQYNLVHRTLGNLLATPEGQLTADSFMKAGQSMVNQKLMTPEQYAQFVTPLPTRAGSESDTDYEKKLRQYAGMHMLQAQEKHDAIGYFAGQNVEQHDNQNIISGIQGQVTPGGPTGLNRSPFQQRSVTPLQPPMGTEFVPPATPQNPNPAPQKVIGGSPPVTYPVGKTGGLPVAQPPNAAGGVQGAAPGLKTVQGQYAPGVAEGARETGQASGTQLAEARKVAANYQEASTPLEKGIDALERLGTKGTGPGTETINQFKSFLLSNVPNITEKDLASVKDFDTARKYFVQFARQNGDTGTNDKLAAAFSGNPGTSMSNAAAQDVAKTALSIFRMKVAMTKDFEKSGLPDSQYGKWANENSDKYDPRAFGADKMSPENRTKLRTELEKNPEEYKKFRESFEAAKKYGLVK